MSYVLAGLKCTNADHAAIMPRPVQSQLHQDVVRVLRTAQYTAFAAMPDNLTESAVRQGITVFAPSNGALSDFQKNKTQELRILEEIVRIYHEISDVMPFSKLQRLDLGSILKTDVSNISIVVTNATAASFKVNDAARLSTLICTLRPPLQYTASMPSLTPQRSMKRNVI